MPAAAPWGLLPGTWDIKVSHIVEQAKAAGPAPANWIGSRIELADGVQVDADLGSMRREIARDLDMRVDLSPFVDR